MPAAPPPAQARASIDVRALSLAQLQKLAERGSRRARAELEGRMRAAAANAATAASPPPQATPAPPSVAPLSITRAPVVAPALTPLATPANPTHDDAVRRLEVMARQDEARARAGGPPRLMGMVLIAWGALMLLGGLILATRGGGWYYAACGAGSATVGWLLMQRRRWAMLLHGVLLLVAIAWAWKAAKGSLGLALVQSAPLWIAALWMALPAVREPLE